MPLSIWNSLGKRVPFLTSCSVAVLKLMQAWGMIHWYGVFYVDPSDVDSCYSNTQYIAHEGKYYNCVSTYWAKNIGHILCLRITAYLCSTSEYLHAYSGESMSVATRSKVVLGFTVMPSHSVCTISKLSCHVSPAVWVTLCLLFFAHCLSFAATSSFLSSCSLSLLASFWLLFSSYYSSLYTHKGGTCEQD